jgi:3-hydroxyisobutyrate dehydrogenase-like beta-hydroxyacid dehydrogenase
LARTHPHAVIIMDIGFIGLGHMGGGIAAKLLKPGRRLKVWNRSPEPVSLLVAEGAVAATNPADALDVDIAFSMLASDEIIEAVIVESSRWIGRAKA